MSVPGGTRVALAALAVALFLAPGTPTADRPGAETSWGVRLFVGFPFNLPTPVRIRQEGEPDLRFRARFATRPFERPWYYGVGLFRRAGGGEWSAELIHHKIYLQNPPPEVQDFSISHGYNFLLLGYAAEVAEGLWARGAGGLVLAHPESTVRGREQPQDRGLFGRGYYLAGPALSVGLEGRVPSADRARLALGARLIGGFASVPVPGGSAQVPNVALHATAGVEGDVLRSR